jgi:membrane-associated phospholipid phosphatase
MLSRPLVALLVLGFTHRTAIADGTPEHDPARSGASDFDWSLPDRSYLWDGGMVPFVYAPLALTLGLRGQEPADQPVMFSPSEGGQTYNGGQYPVAMLYVDAAAAGGMILFGGDDSRWYHLKGFAEGVATTELLTTIAKNTFGRHRPMYDLDPGAANPADSRKSFWSGHASSTLATATYLGLYARQHLFNRWRPAGELRWWEGVAYVGLAAGALAIPYSQYALHRHHASDVIVGSAVGASVSTLFYIYQERRYRQHKAGRDRESSPFEISVVPNTSINGVTLMGTW